MLTSHFDDIIALKILADTVMRVFASAFVKGRTTLEPERCGYDH